MGIDNQQLTKLINELVDSEFIVFQYDPIPNLNPRDKVVLGSDDGKDCIYVGETPDVYDNKSWADAEQLFEKVWGLIKSEFAVSKGSDKNSFVIESEELCILMDDLMPIGIYPKLGSGNPIIQKIFICLQRH